MAKPDGGLLLRISKALEDSGITEYNKLQINDGNAVHFTTLHGEQNTTLRIIVGEGFYSISYDPSWRPKSRLSEKEIEDVTGITTDHNQFMDVLGYICARHYLSGPDDLKRQKLEQIINRFKIDSEPEVSPESTPGQ